MSERGRAIRKRTTEPSLKSEFLQFFGDFSFQEQHLLLLVELFLHLRPDILERVEALGQIVQFLVLLGARKLPLPPESARFLRLLIVGRSAVIHVLACPVVPNIDLASVPALAILGPIAAAPAKVQCDILKKKRAISATEFLGREFLRHDSCPRATALYVKRDHRSRSRGVPDVDTIRNILDFLHQGVNLVHPLFFLLPRHFPALFRELLELRHLLGQ